ncbi:MAG: AAA family ATPase [Oscillospiraceae bacterium]|nr:AAA family ATPase [Oscillospiraceae bacterium]
MNMNNKLMPVTMPKSVMIDAIYEETDQRTICRGIILRKTSKGWYAETGKKLLFAFHNTGLEVGAIYSLEAHLESDTTYDALYEVRHAELLACASYAAMCSFLLRSGGMTLKRSRLLLERYGMDVLAEIVNDYYALDFLGLSPDVQSSLYLFAADRLLFGIILQLLMTYKLDCRLASEVYDKYKKEPLERTVSTILDNPYTLFMDEVCTFNEADALYLRMGNPENSEMRCRYAILGALHAEEDNGSICIPRQDLHGAVWTLLKQTECVADDAPCPFTGPNVTLAISQLKERKLIAWDKVGEKYGIYLQDSIIDERTVSRYLTEVMSSAKSLYFSPAEVDQALADYEADSGFTLDDEQRAAVRAAILESVSIITGGPGTGKTQTLKAIREVLLYLCSEARIAGCAPTGKAAVRMKETSGLDASTIHRLLKITPDDDWVERGALECDYVIVDEATMMDTRLASRLLYALEPTARLILVGDVDQLPSVGPGRVFADLIESGVIPVTRLVKNHRQAGGGNIQANTRATVNQKPGQPIVWNQSTGTDGDFYVVEQEDPMERMRTLKGAYRQGRESGLSCLDVVVLTPEHHGALGTNNTNETFQQEFNPDTEHRIQVNGKEFRLGDPVRHTKNNYALNVMNGETGVITEVGKDILIVKYADNRYVQYGLPEIQTELELAYAISIHQAQGSEWPMVLIPVYPSPLLTKNTLYTAISRGKELVVLTGRMSSLGSGLRREIKRYTLLTERIRLAVEQQAWQRAGAATQSRPQAFSIPETLVS